MRTAPGRVGSDLAPFFLMGDPAVPPAPEDERPRGAVVDDETIETLARQLVHQERHVSDQCCRFHTYTAPLPAARALRLVPSGLDGVYQVCEAMIARCEQLQVEIERLRELDARHAQRLWYRVGRKVQHLR